MRNRSGWRLLTTGNATLTRRLAAQGRKVTALGTVVIVAVALIVTGVVFPGTHRAVPPVQQQWGSAAGRPHRVSAAVTMGRIVNGRVIHTAATSGLPGPAAPRPAGRPKGAVPWTPRPKPLRLPARGSSADKTRVLGRPGGQGQGFEPQDQP